tara:strand:- start:486 stop:869 length:384 start_codon:yes stop_codon:yes gene_type:complete
MRNSPLKAFSSPLKDKPKKLKTKIKDAVKSVKTQGFSNVNVKGVNWGKNVKELKGTEHRQDMRVSGINLSKDFKLNKNLKLNISNPAIVHTRPTFDGSFVGNKFGNVKALPFSPSVKLTYNIPSKRK